MNINTQIFFTLYNLTHHSALFDAIVTFIAGYGDVTMIGVTAISLVIFFIYDRDWKRRRWVAWGREVVIIGIATTIPWFITFILKILFHAPRPFVTFTQVHPLIAETPFTSFPSGHATVFFALAMVVYLYHKRLGYIFFFCAILIALSRIIVGVHYPVDIIAGTFIGLAVAYLVHNILYNVKYLFPQKQVK
jgi:undecaprenyl-diphosphatase